MTMNLDHEELHRLLATLAESDIQEFRLEGEDFCLEVKRNLGSSSDLITTSPKKITSEEIDPPLPQRKIEASTAPITPPPSVPGSRSDFCLLYTSPSPRDRQKSRMPSSA